MEFRSRIFYAATISPFIKCFKYSKANEKFFNDFTKSIALSNNIKMKKLLVFGLYTNFNRITSFQNEIFDNIIKEDEFFDELIPYFLNTVENIPKKYLGRFLNKLNENTEFFSTAIVNGLKPAKFIENKDISKVIEKLLYSQYEDARYFVYRYYIAYWQRLREGFKDLLLKLMLKETDKNKRWVIHLILASEIIPNEEKIEFLRKIINKENNENVILYFLTEFSIMSHTDLTIDIVDDIMNIIIPEIRWNVIKESKETTGVILMFICNFRSDFLKRYEFILNEFFEKLNFNLLIADDNNAQNDERDDFKLVFDNEHDKMIEDIRKGAKQEKNKSDDQQKTNRKILELNFERIFEVNVPSF